MEAWLKTCLLLCLYGFFKELRPSEPYLTEYLLGPQHNLTESQVYYDVYPVWTYSYLSLLIAVFLLTDLLKYKPVIVFEALGYIATWSLLLWSRGVRWLQFMEFCFAITTATEVAYYTYIYAQVDSKHYLRVSSYTRAAILAGKSIAGILGQVFISFGLLDFHTLNYVSLASICVAFVISILLPPVKTSIYFHRKTSYIPVSPLAEVKTQEFQKTDAYTGVNKTGRDLAICNNNVSLEDKKTWTVKFKQVLVLLWQDFKDGYSNPILLKWSLWWAFATCITFQVANYIQPLWESITPWHQTEVIYNGAVESASTFLGALAAIAVGYLSFNWTILGELSLGLISLIDAALLILMGLTSHIWVAYANYIAFRVSYEILITIASYQIAKGLKAESYGLIFGFNMFVALAIQCVLTVIVIEWLHIEPGQQFVIYGCYFGVLAVVFLFMASHTFLTLGCRRIQSEGLWGRREDETRPQNTSLAASL